MDSTAETTHLRTRIWNNLANIRFKGIYCQHCSNFSGTCSTVLSLFLALTSTGSVAAWAIWKDYPNVWGLIIALSQVAQVAKPLIPFIGADKHYMETAFEFDRL